MGGVGYVIAQLKTSSENLLAHSLRVLTNLCVEGETLAVDVIKILLILYSS